MKKYVVLEHLTLPDRGLRFYSTNSADCEKLADGSIVYKKIAETDDADEAYTICTRYDRTKVATVYELMEFYITEAGKSRIKQD